MMAKTYYSTTGGTKSTKMVLVGPDGLKVSQEAHDEMVEYINCRIKGFNIHRSPMIARYREIDKELSGHILPNTDDAQRIRDNRRGKGPKTVDENCQFALMQLDEAVTFMMGVYAPDGGMYSAITSKDKQPVANGVSALMNKHARVFKHYRHMSKAILDMFKYNLGGLYLNWDVVRGEKIKYNGAIREIVENTIINQGNNQTAIDPYNFIWDPACYPVDLNAGEFAGEVDLIRPYLSNSYQDNGFYFSIKNRVDYTYGQVRWYEPKPMISHQYIPDGPPINNWDQLFGAKYGSGSGDPDSGDFLSQSVERLRFHLWINPKKTGFGKEDMMQLWRFHTLNGRWIVRAERMKDIHRRLPYSIGCPNEDGMNLQSRTFAEMLLPFSRFASSQINVHQRAARKRLFGLTIYNRNIIPLLENEDLGGGKVPANPMSADFDLNKAILQFNDAPDTSESMRDVESAMQLMQRILPTTQAQQVASLERATRYQAAALVQASNKRNLKLAKTIDDQALDVSRQMQVSNIIQYQDKVNVIDVETGDELPVDPQQFADLEIQFAIADGLRGIDRLMIVESLHEIINILVQSPVARDYDVGALLNYFMELQGEKWDFSQFKYKSPIDALPPEQKAVAFELFQRASQQASGAKAADASGNNVAPGGAPGLTPFAGGPNLGQQG